MLTTRWTLLALTAICGALPGHVHAAEPQGYWITPDQGISCAFSDNKLRCDVAQPNWKPWGCKDNGCYGSSFVIPSRGKATMIRSSDTTWNPKATVIGDGFSIAGIRCRLEAKQLSCHNPSGGRLVLSRNAYALNR
ncbi:MAG: hypothetical protein VKM98_07930 [Cyanobacteriota bacterium]|nr:hypothetical protein [Cyanobacteriota bacterium]